MLGRRTPSDTLQESSDDRLQSSLLWHPVCLVCQAPTIIVDERRNDDTTYDVVVTCDLR